MPCSTWACHLDGEHHRLAVDDLGVRPVQERAPILLGGHGRKVVGVAGRHADIFQFTGLTHAADGTSVDRITDELERNREAFGISHVVVRDAEGFAPVVEALTGR